MYCIDNLSLVTSKKLASLENACKIIQQIPNVRFVGIINKMGHLIAGGFKNDIIPHVDQTGEHIMYMQLILDLKMRKEFDDTLGNVQYIHSQRDKVSMICIPIGSHLVLVSSELDVNPAKIVKIAKNELIELRLAGKMKLGHS